MLANLRWDALRTRAYLDYRVDDVAVAILRRTSCEVVDPPVFGAGLRS